MSQVEAKGARFSHLYISQDAPLRDSEKARFRLAKLCEASCPKSKPDRYGSTTEHFRPAVKAIESEIGISFASRSTSGSYHERWDWFFNRVTVVELLDTITIVGNTLHSNMEKYDRRGAFLETARRIFKEENLGYTIDEEGGVHPLVDSAFTATHSAAIAALSGERHKATLDAVAKVDVCLLQDPPDYREAIRASFAANENLFKLMYSVPRLDARSAGDKIGTSLQSLYDGHPTQQSANAKLLESYKDWINAAHFYRHEEGVEEPSQPSEDLAILMVSQGLSFVRWLAGIDRLSPR
ncbi:MAG: hypothetical protein AAFU82_15700 [Pseudomonadota bacterium]